MSETDSQKLRRYQDAEQCEVSDPDAWATIHYGPPALRGVPDERGMMEFQKVWDKEKHQESESIPKDNAWGCGSSAEVSSFSQHQPRSSKKWNQTGWTESWGMKRFVVILGKGSIKAGCKPFPLVQTVQIPCQLEQLYMSRSSCRVLYCSVHQWYVWSAFGARKTCTLLSPLDTFFSWNPFLLHFCFFWQPFLMPPGFWQLLSHAKTLSRTLIKISIGFWHLFWPRGANGASASDQQRLNSTIWHGLMVERKTKIIQNVWFHAVSICDNLG